VVTDQLCKFERIGKSCKFAIINLSIERLCKVLAYNAVTIHLFLYSLLYRL